MISCLKEFYNDVGELVVHYDPGQEGLYLQATRELWEAATSKNLTHHSQELQQVRAEIQQKYGKQGLELDLFSLPKGIHKNEGNFSAMVLKQFLKRNGFQVLVSEEDYYLMWERNHHRTNEGFSVITGIFGTNKIQELLTLAPQGGDPDVFAFLNHDPAEAWFIEAKRRNERPTKKQIQNFPFLKQLLCPVEIARVQPLEVKKE